MRRPSSRAWAAFVLIFYHAVDIKDSLEKSCALAQILAANASMPAGASALVSSSGCPEECVCMWKSGKETTECINRDRDAIPEGIEPSTQVLDLRGNNIRVLANEVSQFQILCFE